MHCCSLTCAACTSSAAAAGGCACTPATASAAGCAASPVPAVAAAAAGLAVLGPSALAGRLKKASSDFWPMAPLLSSADCARESVGRASGRAVAAAVTLLLRRRHLQLPDNSAVLTPRNANLAGGRGMQWRSRGAWAAGFEQASWMKLELLQMTRRNDRRVRLLAQGMFGQPTAEPAWGLASGGVLVPCDVLRRLF